MPKLPHFEFEKELWNQDYVVIGIDEVGRGCLAGPVTVSGVCFLPQTKSEIERFQTLGINDSKKVLPQKRKQISDLLKAEKLLYSLASSDTDMINSQGIVPALNTAILKVIELLQDQLLHKRISILLDGTNLPDFPHSPNTTYRNIIKGDGISLSIAAASILAKVERDAYMEQLHNDFPHYNWKSNKGYGTKDHRESLKQYGPCPHHRTLFIRNCL